MIHCHFRRPIYAARYICLQTPFNMLIDIYININVCLRTAAYYVVLGVHSIQVVALCNFRLTRGDRAVEHS